MPDSDSPKPEEKPFHWADEVELSEEGVKIIEEVLDPNSPVGKPKNYKARMIEERDNYQSK